MDSDTARRLYRQIEATKLVELKKELLTFAVRYARLRTDWQLADVDERKGMDSHRTATHDALIDACNVLSRNMAKAGEDASWRATMSDRKEIGDFACYIHCLIGLAAR
jgi:hypothetical protein